MGLQTNIISKEWHRVVQQGVPVQDEVGTKDIGGEGAQLWQSPGRQRYTDAELQRGGRMRREMRRTCKEGMYLVAPPFPGDRKSTL